MHFFSKQISTIFLSLFFFLISSEGWGAEQAVTLPTTCDPTTTCASHCVVTSNIPVFNGVGVGSITSVIADGGTPTNTQETVTSCKLRCAAVCISLKGDLEYAAPSTSSNTFTKSMCNALRLVTGSAGKTFAAFAIIATGIGFFSGKVSWGLMIGVAAGIATMFGAPSIVAAISGTTVDSKCTLATGSTGS